MPDDDSDKYRIIDHTAKANDQRCANPNRLAARQEARRRMLALEEMLADELDTANATDRLMRAKRQPT